MAEDVTFSVISQLKSQEEPLVESHIVHIKHNEANQEEKEALPSAFKPMISVFKLTGMTFKDYSEEKVSPFWVVYAVIFNASQISVVLRLIFAYDSPLFSGPLFLGAVIMHVTAVNFVTVSLLFVHSFYKSWPGIVTQWQTYRSEYSGINLREIQSFVKKIFIHVNLLLLAINIFFLLLESFHPILYMRFGCNPILANFEWPPNPFLIMPILAQVFLIIMAFSQPFLFIIAICHLLSKEFIHLFEEFKSSIQDKAIITLEHERTETEHYPEIEVYRRRHLVLCQIVELVDHMMSGITLIFLTISVLGTVAVIFLVAFFGMFGMELGDYAIKSTLGLCGVGATLCVLMISVITYIGTSLLTASKLPRTILYEADIHKMSPKEIGAAQIFISKINSDHVGLTMWKVVKIDRPLILTGLTIVISYVALLLKFSQSLGGSTSNIAQAESTILFQTTETSINFT